jgi:hypothetical protein
VHVPVEDGCDDLNPRHCMLPWPSDRWLAADATRATGYHLEYDPHALPRPRPEAPFDVAPFRRLDGYSPASQILTMFDAPADLTAAATVDHIERSLDADSPTVLIDMTTGERLAHWLENDARAESPSATVLYLRPARVLAQDHDYAVAIRGLKGPDGATFGADPAFAALRDGQRSDAPALEARRPGFERMFAALDRAGVARADLQQAWWFHTESYASGHDTMMAMRADALDHLGATGLGCHVTSAEDDFGGIAYRKVKATVTVPWYMTAPQQPAELARDADGRPVYQRTQEVPFTVILPHSLADAHRAGPLIIWGHGLFGNADDTVSSADLLRVAESQGVVLASTDWAGMSTKDLGFLALALADVSKFYRVGEMLQQGMINQIALTRSLLGVCKELPELTADGTPLIDPEHRYFIGGSQGSILGGAFLPLSPDIDRGALIVGGAAFSFMIERSIHYHEFEPLLTPSYPSRVDRALLMAFSQHIWDRAETANYLPYAQDGLPGGGTPKQYLYLIARNDAQVPNLSSDLAVRSAGLPALEGTVRLPWGVEQVASPYTGSAFIAMNYGDRPVPDGNLAPADDDGGHGNVGLTAPAMALIDGFLLTGTNVVTCGGPCDVGPAAP